MIEFAGVTKISKEDGSTILKNVDATINKGEFVYLIGDSGAGKTTFLKMIYRDIKPNSGIIIVDDVDVNKLKTKKVPYLRRKLGVVFQDFKLLKKRTVYKNIAYALEVINVKTRDIERRVDEVLNFIKMDDKKDFPIEKLSGGEKQRVALARAIINNPGIILCDEITGNLNYEITESIMKLLFKLNKNGTTIIFSTHDEKILENFPSRKIELNKGVVVNGKN